MPYVNIKLTGDEEAPSAEEKKRLIAEITRVIRETLHKDTANCVVVIEEISMDNYGIGGMTVRERRSRRARVDKPAQTNEKRVGPSGESSR